MTPLKPGAGMGRTRLTPEELAALTLFLVHAVGLGDVDGFLGHAEIREIARTVAAELDSGSRRITSKFGAFVVRVTLERVP